MDGALQYLESQRNAQPELADWYNALEDLYQKKLWHQLTLKLEQFVALAVFQAGDALIQLYHNFITDFESKINILKLAQFAVVVSRQYAEKEGENIYNSGELLVHPIINSLLGTKIEWVYHLLQAFNTGDLVSYHELCRQAPNLFV